MRIFIAGATGVIGRRVVPQLLAAGHQITAIARSAAAQSALKQMGAAWTPASLFDLDALKTGVRAHDTVINLATHVPPSSRSLFPGAWRETGRIRREGSANLMVAARAAGGKRFIQESFAADLRGSRRAGGSTRALRFTRPGITPRRSTPSDRPTSSPAPALPASRSASRTSTVPTAISLGT